MCGKTVHHDCAVSRIPRMIEDALREECSFVVVSWDAPEDGHYGIAIPHPLYFARFVRAGLLPPVLQTVRLEPSGRLRMAPNERYPGDPSIPIQGAFFATDLKAVYTLRDRVARLLEEYDAIVAHRTPVTVEQYPCPTD